MNNLKVTFIVPSFILGIMFSGCQLPRALTTNDLQGGQSDIHVRTVTFLDGTQLDCRTDSSGFSVLRDSMLVWKDGDGNQRLIPVDSIANSGGTRYPTRGENATQTLIIGASVIGLIFLLARHRIEMPM